MADKQEVLTFWLQEVGPERWYKSDPALDAEIRERFEPTWQAAAEGRRNHWRCDAGGMLAFLIVTDQFPRNMFRGEARAFETDDIAHAAALKAIKRDLDLDLPERQRQFVYMPLMHSESLADQDHCVRLILARMPDEGANNLLHARVHREIIRRFGRFPYRNAALGRPSTPQEEAFLENEGYGAILNELKQPA